MSTIEKSTIDIDSLAKSEDLNISIIRPNFEICINIPLIEKEL